MLLREKQFVRTPERLLPADQPWKPGWKSSPHRVSSAIRAHAFRTGGSSRITARPTGRSGWFRSNPINTSAF